MSYDVVVVGSLNHDLTLRVPRQPHPGETLLGYDRYSGPGGKGANQAVAAARLGSRVAMIGRVGRDPEGRGLFESLIEAGVDVSGVVLDDQAATGMAVIVLDDSAENAIVVIPGANARLRPQDVDAAGAEIETASVVLAQLEVPVEAVAAAAEHTRGRLILNPAPARPLPDDLWRRVDVLVPNRSELGRLAGVATPHGHDEVAAAVRRLPRQGATVVTLGAEGVLVVDGEEVVPVASPAVEAVDTTGAGDAFCAALAAALSAGASVVEGARWAAAAGALATTALGARAALPTRAEVERLLGA